MRKRIAIYNTLHWRNLWEKRRKKGILRTQEYLQDRVAKSLFLFGSSPPHQVDAFLYQSHGFILTTSLATSSDWGRELACHARDKTLMHGKYTGEGNKIIVCSFFWIVFLIKLYILMRETNFLLKQKQKYCFNSFIHSLNHHLWYLSVDVKIVIL